MMNKQTPGGRKIALINGITGQNGSYLTELLLEKGYEVHGIVRRSLLINTSRIGDIYKDKHDTGAKLFLHDGDLCDAIKLTTIIKKVKPTEIYNLGSTSQMKNSDDMSKCTTDLDGVGVSRMLDAIRSADMEKTVRFYQASTNGVDEKLQGIPQPVTVSSTPPRSPYTVRNQSLFWILVNYREAYGTYLANGKRGPVPCRRTRLEQWQRSIRTF